jgi:hypothetical protein
MHTGVGMRLACVCVSVCLFCFHPQVVKGQELLLVYQGTSVSLASS